jgi:hypothetical protein
MKIAAQSIAILLFTACLTVFCFDAYAQNMEYLDANNVKAGFYPGGVLFSSIRNDTFLGKASYEVPIGSGSHSVFSSSLWLTCKDDLGNLHGAISAYNPLYDLVSGPISSGYDAQYDSIYHRVIKVTRYEIANHVAYYNNWGYVMPDGIRNWPGNGRTSKNETANLAPFYDKNGNGVYEPENGDYPDICGDQSVFYVLNDMRNTSNESGCNKMNIEMNVSAYAFSSSLDSVLNNTVFVKLKMTNHSNFVYRDLRFSYFMDADLGCYNNDRIGCDTSLQSFYVYNDIGNEAIQCGGMQTLGYGTKRVAQGVTFLNHSLNLFNFLFDPFPQFPTGGCRYYNQYQNGIFSDGSHLTLGGDGYGGATNTEFAFPGNPTVVSQWSEVNPQFGAPKPAGDRREIGTLILDSLRPSESKWIDFAIITTAKDSVNDPYGEVSMLLQDIQHIRNLYQMQLKSCTNTYTSIEHFTDLTENVNIFPNPTSGILHISLSDYSSVVNISIFNVSGQQLLKNASTSSEMDLNLSSFAKGIYLLKVQSGENTTVKRIVVE